MNVNYIKTDMKDNETRPWEPYIPDYVEMYYVDYRDDLSDHIELLQECIDKNSKYPIDEKIDEWWDYPEERYIETMRCQMERDGIEWDDDWIDEIRDALWDKDESDAVASLLENTGALTMFYSLGVEIDGWHEAFMCNPWRGESYAMAAYKIRRALGIKKGSKEAEIIQSLVNEAGDGGDLRIYFEAPLDDVLSRNWEEHDKDFKSIRFKGKVALALYNPGQGSGWYEEIEIDREFPFVRANLALSDSERWPIESTFGLCGDWLNGTAAPQLSFDESKKRRKFSVASLVQDREREAEFERVFKAGGCTRGDMNYSRHRDVAYRNDIPCGSVCPHCGTFWID